MSQIWHIHYFETEDESLACQQEMDEINKSEIFFMNNSAGYKLAFL